MTLDRYYINANMFLQDHYRSPSTIICFTNGCFDILHPGHVRYLEDIRALGHFLIVGLNSDASVSRLKGSHRPIQSELARAILLCSLRSVDAVIKFDEDTPLSLISAIKPNILAKGGDYSYDKIVGRDIVKSYGGIVLSMPILTGYSTSKIVERIEFSLSLSNLGL